MIRNESEYKQAVENLRNEEKRLKEHVARLETEGLKANEIKRVLDPFKSFHLQLMEEVESYERLKRGDLGEIKNLSGVGGLLVAARIARGITQRELAERLGVSESVVSRDERNEYHGITIERASKILMALGIQMRAKVSLGPLPTIGKGGEVLTGT